MATLTPAGVWVTYVSLVGDFQVLLLPNFTFDTGTNLFGIQDAEWSEKQCSLAFSVLGQQNVSPPKVKRLGKHMWSAHKGPI